MKKKVYLISKQTVNRYKRTIGFFNFHNDSLYYSIGLLDGSHDSFHKDGSLWRTSLATNNKARRDGHSTPLKNFKGLTNLGVAMLSKDVLKKLPKVKNRYFKRNIIYQIDLDIFPLEFINIVVEIVNPNSIILTPYKEMIYPNKSINKIFDFGKVWLIITLLGHEENYLIKPEKQAFKVRHINKRFTANADGNNFIAEVYSKKAF